MSKPTDKVVSAGITSALVETEQEDIQHRIFTIRGMQVMLDSDLAKFYGIETKRINEQVKRNPDRFPEDFVFQLTKEEVEFTRSQNATLDTSADGNLVCTRSQNASLNTKRGQNIKYLPYVEQLIADAKKEVILIDNYINARTFDILEARQQGVNALSTRSLSGAICKMFLLLTTHSILIVPSL